MEWNGMYLPTYPTWKNNYLWLVENLLVKTHGKISSDIAMGLHYINYTFKNVGFTL